MPRTGRSPLKQKLPPKPLTANSHVSPTQNTRPVVEKSLSASLAKTHLLELLEAVDRRSEPFVITKRGRPVARLIPIQAPQPAEIFGCMRGTFRITGDIVSPEPDTWEAMN